VIPPFGRDGLLPIGTHRASFTDLRQSHLVVGSNVPYWDAAHRARLVDNAEVLVGQLWQVGITEVFLDGSFVEAKPRPNDIDGYFEVDVFAFATGKIEMALNALDPHKVWTWDPRSRKPARGSTKKQLPMWHRYRVELYPHHPGLLSGITDIHGNELQFPSAFRQQRGTGARKGIIKIEP
jgi:hypothetical protein